MFCKSLSSSTLFTHTVSTTISYLPHNFLKKPTTIFSRHVLLYLMRNKPWSCLEQEGIIPAWEDDANKNGGKWSIQLPKEKNRGHVDKMWLYTVYGPCVLPLVSTERRGCHRCLLRLARRLTLTSPVANVLSPIRNLSSLVSLSRLDRSFIDYQSGQGWLPQEMMINYASGSKLSGDTLKLTCLGMPKRRNWLARWRPRWNFCLTKTRKRKAKRRRSLSEWHFVFIRRVYEAFHARS